MICDDSLRVLRGTGLSAVQVEDPPVFRFGRLSGGDWRFQLRKRFIVFIVFQMLHLSVHSVGRWGVKSVVGEGAFGG